MAAGLNVSTSLKKFLIIEVLEIPQNSKEQKAHSFDLFDAAASRRNAHAPTAAIFVIFLARSSQPE